VTILRLLAIFLYAPLTFASPLTEDEEPAMIPATPRSSNLSIVRTYQSPNFSSREDAEIDTLIMHYTAVGFDAAMKTLTLQDSKNPVSSHYLVGQNGGIFQLVPDEHEAWHAGVSSWKGVSGLNKNSIGIEIVNMGNEPFPQEQMESVRNLSVYLIRKYNIPAARVLGHSDVAPTRKQDPGPLFDWEWLAENGIGINPKSLDHPVVNTFQYREDFGLLRTIGYEPVTTETQTSILKAFQMHYVRHNVSGEMDDLTVTRMVNLANLVEAKSAKLKLSGNEPR